MVQSFLLPFLKVPDQQDGKIIQILSEQLSFHQESTCNIGFCEVISVPDEPSNIYLIDHYSFEPLVPSAPI